MLPKREGLVEPQDILFSAAVIALLFPGKKSVFPKIFPPLHSPKLNSGLNEFADSRAPSRITASFLFSKRKTPFGELNRALFFYFSVVEGIGALIQAELPSPPAKPGWGGLGWSPFSPHFLHVQRLPPPW